MLAFESGNFVPSFWPSVNLIFLLAFGLHPHKHITDLLWLLATSVRHVVLSRQDAVFCFFHSKQPAAAPEMNIDYKGKVWKTTAISLSLRCSGKLQCLYKMLFAFVTTSDPSVMACSHFIFLPNSKYWLEQL